MPTLAPAPDQLAASMTVSWLSTLRTLAQTGPPEPIPAAQHQHTPGPADPGWCRVCGAQLSRPRIGWPPRLSHVIVRDLRGLLDRVRALEDL